MEIKYDIATKDDIKELIRLRIAYMMDDFGSVSEDERIALDKQLPDYFLRKLGSELIAFVARDENRIVSVAYLLIIEMPANLMLLNGIYGDVLNVYTEPEYRGKGLATSLMNNLIEYGKKAGLGRIDLMATDDGYPIYKKVGFEDKKQKYKDMVYKIK